MSNSDIYKTWRDRLLVEVSERICLPCSDDRKQRYNLDYGNPLSCGCRCARIEVILKCVHEIDDEIKKHSPE